LDDWPGEVLRFNMLRTHYRQPMDWTMHGLKESWTILERWYAIAEPVASPSVGDNFLAALCDDLNTPLALSELHKAKDTELAGGLGLLGFSNVEERIAAKPPVDVVQIAEAIAARNAARKARNFKEADRLRDELAAKGIVLKDSPTGTIWEVKR
jgi:cysteinyl-tRNA synthetase